MEGLWLLAGLVGNELTGLDVLLQQVLLWPWHAVSVLNGRHRLASVCIVFLKLNTSLGVSGLKLYWFLGFQVFDSFMLFGFRQGKLEA